MQSMQLGQCIVCKAIGFDGSPVAILLSPMSSPTTLHYRENSVAFMNECRPSLCTWVPEGISHSHLLNSCLTRSDLNTADLNSES